MRRLNLLRRLKMSQEIGYKMIGIHLLCGFTFVSKSGLFLFQFCPDRC